jgi:hypothetical protein
VCVCVFVCMCVFVCVYVCVCVYACVCLRASVRVRVCVHACFVFTWQCTFGVRAHTQSTTKFEYLLSV